MINVVLYAFWMCCFGISYAYLIYPMVLFVIVSVKTRGERGSSTKSEAKIGDSDLPDVTVVLAAYNEESCIEARIKNLLAQDYPAEKLRIMVGSDGSTDGTAELLEAISDPRLDSHVFQENRGKINVLNDLMGKVSTDLVVLTDANTEFESHAIKQLVKHFRRPDVGVVCGELHLVGGQESANRDGVYWRYEQLLKRMESKIGALLGANGAIYAIRTDLYEALPADTVVDDFQIAMNVAKQGYELVYEQEARAYEEIAPSLADEHGRRVRIGTGNYQALARTLWALNPVVGLRSFTFFSHKVVRWFVPHLMLIALVTNAILAVQPAYLVLLCIQIAIYGAAWIGHRKIQVGKPVGSILAFITFFVAMNLALLRGFVKYVTDDVSGSWKRTAR